MQEKKVCHISAEIKQATRHPLKLCSIVQAITESQLYKPEGLLSNSMDAKVSSIAQLNYFSKMQNAPVTNRLQGKQIVKF